MNHRSTQVQLAHDGSTRPDTKWQEIEREAIAIREQWLVDNGRRIDGPLKNPECLRRHKSLVLNLILEDYQREKSTVDQSIPLQEYCRRFHGMGDSFEQSIVRQLEVQQYLDHHPELINLESAFVWPEPGDNFLQFNVLEEIGRGALARVYLCKQQELGGRSAIVKIALGSKAFEASLLGKLRHSHIMPIHWADHDSVAGASYICMPFLGRSTLVDLIDVAFCKGTPTNAAVIQEAAKLWIRPIDAEYIDSTVSTNTSSFRASYITGIVRLAADIADALAYAHKQEIIHGDIKPSNVLLTSNGSPLLFDFNLGRELKCLDGPAGGTLAYMAPEQMLSLTEKGSNTFTQPTVATDTYSFGALLYELLFGKSVLAIPAEPTETKAIARQLYGQQRSKKVFPEKSVPVLDDPLVALLEECLAFEPSKRPTSMEQVRDRLVAQALLPARGRRYVKKHPLRSWLIGITLVAVTLWAAVGAYLRPPYAQRLVLQAVAAREAGEYQASIALLNKALNDDPNIQGAHLERARCHLKLKDYVLARSDLQHLARVEKNPSGMAYLAFCHCMTNDYKTAKKWHESALSHGLKTAGILNNFSVSILIGNNQRSLQERIVQSKIILDQALAMKPESLVIRMNAIRLATMQLAQDPNYFESDAEEHVVWLCQKYPKDGRHWKVAFDFYLFLAQRDPKYHSQAYTCLSKAVELGAGPTPKQLSLSAIYIAYRKQPSFSNLLESAKKAEGNRPATSLASIGRFLDPITSEP